MNQLGVLIREQTRLSNAWFGYDYAMLNTDGGFLYNFADETRPFFKSDEEKIMMDYEVKKHMLHNEVKQCK